MFAGSILQLKIGLLGISPMIWRRVLVPAFVTPPRDFSKIVVNPPALLPADGLLFISAPLRAQYFSHQRIRLTSFSPTSREAARRRALNRAQH